MMSACPTGQVINECRSKLQGTPAYRGHFCLTNRPHTIVGPVCWNGQCYGAEETRRVCESSSIPDGWFVGGKAPNYAMHTTGTNNNNHNSPYYEDDTIIIESLEMGWCVVPGEDHTLFGPACYGSVCYTTELMAACQKLNGTNFANLFCLLPHRYYTVIGPVCTPTPGAVDQAPQCSGDETAQLCQEMGGTNVGDIFCILPGHHYSVLGPFCDTVISRSDEPGTTILYPICVSPEEGTSACQSLSGRSIANGTFCILEDSSDYHLLGPLCDGGGACVVFDEICRSDFAGQPVGSFFCIIKGEYTMVGPASYGGLYFVGGDEHHMLARNVHENMVHDVVGNWYVLNGSYSVYGPTCYGKSCYQGDCVGAGGSLIGSIFCVMKIKSTTGGSFSSFLPSLVAAVALAGGLCLFLLRYKRHALWIPYGESKGIREHFVA